MKHKLDFLIICIVSKEVYVALILCYLKTCSHSMRFRDFSFPNFFSSLYCGNKREPIAQALEIAKGFKI